MTIKEIKNLLEKQDEMLSAMLNIIKKERSAMKSRDYKEVEQCASEKLKIIESIKLNDDLLATHPAKEKLTSEIQLKHAIDKLKEKFANCHAENEINGIALQQAQQTNQKLKNIFLKCRGKNSMTYGSEGQTINKNSLGTNLKV